ncbi:MAG: DUF4145 domain-containing protein, partial [Sciscionella sp.]
MTEARFAQLAAGSPNFGRLLEHEPVLVSYGVAAETSVYADPNTSLIKSRQFAEALTDALLARLGASAHGDRQVDKLRTLTEDGVLTTRVGAAFDQIRVAGNQAVHEHFADPRAALKSVESCFRLGEWFHRAVTGSREQIAFVAP